MRRFICCIVFTFMLVCNSHVRVFALVGNGALLGAAKVEQHRPRITAWIDSGLTNTSYSFSASGTDPGGAQIKYGWDWNGDNTVDEWSGLMASGATETRSHTWESAATYNIKVKAENQSGKNLGWSNVKSVVITVPVIVVGQSYGGGIVFYVTGTAPNQHGLVAAASDQGPNIRWYNGTYLLTGATGEAVGTGQANTTKIVNTQGAGTYAASICNNYIATVEGVTYDDWFMPSKDELNQLYINKTAVGGFGNYYYWSSTEYDTWYAWYQVFPSGSQGNSVAKNAVGSVNVRPIRAF